MLKKYSIFLALPVSIIVSYFFFFNDKKDRIDYTEIVIPVESKLKINDVGIDIIVNELASHGKVYALATGYGGEKSDVYKKYEHLKKIASDSELVKLVENKSPVIKAYAFDALAERKYKDIIPVFEQHINDNTGLLIFGGCITSGSYVNVYFFNCIKDLLDQKSYARYRKIIVSMYPKNDWNLKEMGLIPL